MEHDGLPKAGDYVGGRYKIESLLGEGGMGAVFAATNGATGRPVAIKWMLPQMTKSAEALARFLAEARTTARIEHPNVIQVLDVGQDGEAPFLVMERLRGESLGERLARVRQLPPRETIDIILAACRGVAEAHGEGVIHRDLKPDNIYLCEGKDGTPRPPKVLDFGISKLFDETGGQKLTQTGAIMGTPLYMSPEQLDGRVEPDAAFDVYAMGVVLYETLSGTLPYDADTFFVLIQQIVAGQFKPLKRAAPGLPDALVAIVEKAMHPSRQERYKTMGELIAALEGVRDHVPTGAVTGPMPEMGAAAWGEAARTPPAQAVPVTGPMMVGANPPAQNEGSARSPKFWLGVAVGGGALLLTLLIAGAYLLSPDPAPAAAGYATPGVPTAPALPNAPAVPRVPTPPAAGAPNIALRFGGSCTPSFSGGRLVVATGSGALVISSLGAGGLTGSMTVKVPGPGTHPLSTQHMINTQSVINVMANGTMWMNLAQNSGEVMTGRQPDPIRGSLEVRTFDIANARSEIVFHGVTLQNTENGTLCTVDGTLTTSGRVM